MQLQELIPASLSSRKLVQGQSWHRATHWQCWSGVTTLAPPRDMSVCHPLALLTHCLLTVTEQLQKWEVGKYYLGGPFPSLFQLL